MYILTDECKVRNTATSLELYLQCVPFYGEDFAKQLQNAELLLESIAAEYIACFQGMIAMHEPS
jgi:hypothetical protein